jgi:hypothetical protein
MKTAVDWLVDRLYMVIPNEERNFLEGLRKEALEKQKKQIKKAYEDGKNLIQYKDEWGEKYYNQKYNQKEETLEEWKSKFTHNCAIKDNQKQHIIDIMKADEDELEADRQTENQIEEEQINKHQNK